MIGSLLWVIIGFSLVFGDTSWHGFIGDVRSGGLMIHVSYIKCIQGTQIPALLYCTF